MDTYREDKIYYISCRIKSLNGKINLIETEGYSEDSLEDIQAQIEALTNLLEML